MWRFMGTVALRVYKESVRKRLLEHGSTKEDCEFG
jgi:hypothetical protein